MLSIYTVIISPTLTISNGFLTKFLLILEMCNKPSSWSPISTNAPNEATFLTVPFNSIPIFKSSIVRTSLLSITSGASSLGSRPGFFNSLIMSSIVYFSPNSFASSSVLACSKVSLNSSFLISLIFKFSLFNILVVNS